MENNLIIEITKDLEDTLTIKQTENLKITLVKCFSRYDISLKDVERKQEDMEYSKLIDKFLLAKKI